ncbi:MAG: hypothetical protein AAF491_10180, partial [Verrucomicrobiota bacterium]
KTGALFIKSNNRELIYATPGLVPTTRQKNLVPVASIGATPGKSMGGEYVDSEHLPEWIQNHILIAGYYANRVTAFPLVKEEAGYARVEPVEILFSEHGSFRPVEIRIGPDGAFYVADWFNPIIGHYQASLRHPDRDEEHGRIWRITAKGRELNDKTKWSARQRFPDRPVPGAGSAEPRDRLAAVLSAANSEKMVGLAEALRVLDQPTDRFLDYALEQTIHATATKWLPALEEGKLEFEKPEHLAFALETLGSEEAIRYARSELDRSDLGEELRSHFVRVVSRSRDPSDWIYLVKNYPGDASLLASLADVAPSGRRAPVAGAGEIIAPLLGHKDVDVKTEALRLVGAWKLTGLAGKVQEALKSSAEPVKVRSAAASALVRLEGGKAAEVLFSAYEEESGVMKSALLTQLAIVAPLRAASLALGEMEKEENGEDVSIWLTPFFSRAQGMAALAKAVESKGISEETASKVASAMNRVGKNDETLMGLLQDAMGVTSGPRSYSPDFVAALVDEVITHGNHTTGREVYGRAELTCVACHEVAGAGGKLGPSLDAVGAGLTNDLLVESVLWPQRQLKEGYLAILVHTKSGDTFTGYRDRENDGILYLRDTVTGEEKAIPRVEISRIENIGSLMPAGLTNSLTREELRDLVAYLASLKGWQWVKSRGERAADTIEKSYQQSGLPEDFRAVWTDADDFVRMSDRWWPYLLGDRAAGVEFNPFFVPAVITSV